MNLPPLPGSPGTSVVVPARNSGLTLEEAVRSALRQDVPGDLEVVIAVGPSDDDTREVGERLALEDPRIRVLDNPVGTTPAALNAAIAASTGEVVARLDGHAVFTDGYLPRAIELLRDTGAANVGGIQLPVGEPGLGAAVAAAMRSAFGSGGARYRLGGEPGPTDTVYLGVYRRAALEQVGGFDDRLVRNQDYELNHRIREAGGVVYLHPDLVVRYQPRDDVASLARQYYEYGAWKRRVLAIHPGSLRLRQLVPPVFVLVLVASASVAVVTGRVWPVAAVVGAYVLAASSAAVVAADRPRQAPAVAFAYAVMHLAWGSGFLVGRARVGPRRG